MEPNVQYCVNLLMVSNMETSLKFYVDGLGFKILDTWTPHGKIEWCWLQRDGGPLMLQESRISETKPYLAGDKPGAGMSLWFQCRDSLVLYHEFIEKGITVNEPFVGNGLWDVSLKDPDGYSLHFESKTDVPEETKYSDWLKSMDHSR
ncbi:MAG TPA: VOC family protein [Mucilaginibacter sp.]|nr:VOC family protein [Mucilaginibacter sp.]